MADENRDRNDQSDGTMGDESSQNQGKNRQAASSNKNAEQDDVAEDRNLSGSSTWLTLPDQQPSDDDRSENS